MQIQVLPTLLSLPENWPLVPVSGKRPYQKNWVSRQYDRLEVLAELESGKATGLGLKLGNGLLAVDIDGDSAAKLLVKLAGENSLAEFSPTLTRHGRSIVAKLPRETAFAGRRQRQVAKEVEVGKCCGRWHP